MKSIGGYFELELRKGTEYHPDAIKLNSGRNAFRYVLEAKKYKKVYLPFYSCDVLLEPIVKLNLQFEYYSVNRDFEAEFDLLKIDSDNCFLYTNYFGLKDDYIKSLASVCKNLIVDNAQAFFAMPVDNIDTFYSPRKFFGVPDGGYLYTNKLNGREFSKDVSFDRAGHLLIRSDLTAEDGYSVFLENEKRFSEGDIQLMSSLTENILKSIDYERIESIRRENFLFLHENLKNLNQINFKTNQNQVPLCYPFYSVDSGLRKRLIESRIYTAQYWANVLEDAPSGSVEYDYAKNLIHLPIDQRVTAEDLDRIIEIIKI
ncbi:MAG: hypothetical protein M3209_06250 [Acidobacteriota bacterium]|nr:hypothetical protein [Acidobacteriota bacterium]